MNLKIVRDKLVGTKEQRAVSPVIGVILMVAITVILAAVIAAFVLDMGSGLQDSAQAGVSIEGEASGVQTVSVESMANADVIEIRNGDGDVVTDFESVGESATFSNSEDADHEASDEDDMPDEATTYSVVALFSDDSGSNTIATFELE